MRSKHLTAVKQWMYVNQQVPSNYIDSIKTAPLEGHEFLHAVIIEAFNKEWNLLVQVVGDSVEVEMV